MEGWLPIFFLLVVLKIPVFGALWLVWWASRAPEAESAAGEDGDEGFSRWRPMPSRPRGPQHSPPQAGCGERRLRSRAISRR
jgi:hypothetical protein